MKTGLCLKGVSHYFDKVRVLDDVNLEIRAGEIVALLGPSGSGKTTLLRVISGLESLQSGEIWLENRLLVGGESEPPPEARSIGLVFQDHVLFPHLTVRENVGFGLRNVDSKLRSAIVERRLKSVGLDLYSERYPHTLSGGEQQRVALARALAIDPKIMLLDEPFASVDAALRRRLREDTRSALKGAGVPSLIVTHDPEEALSLADRIVIVVGGRVVQDASPEDIWRTPNNRFVAELFGEGGSLSGVVRDGRIETDFGEIQVDGRKELVNGDRIDVVVRPSAVRILASNGPVLVEDIRFLGANYVTQLRAGESVLRSSSATKPATSVGSKVAVTFESEGVLVYCRE